MDDPPSPHRFLQSDLVRAFLAHRDEACPGCGYNLRALTSDMCPECGHRAALCLVRPQPGPPRFATWLAIAALVIFGGSAIWSIFYFATQFSAPPTLPSRILIEMYASSGIRVFLAALAIALGCIRWRRSGPIAGARTLIVSALSVWVLELTYPLIRLGGHSIGLW